MTLDVWQRPRIEKSFIEQERAVHANCPHGRDPSTFAFESAIRHTKKHEDPDASLHAFVLFFISLELNFKSKQLTADQEKFAISSIQDQLLKTGAKNSSSRLHFLSKKLDRIRTRKNTSQTDSWNALWANDWDQEDLTGTQIESYENQRVELLKELFRTANFSVLGSAFETERRTLTSRDGLDELELLYARYLGLKGELDLCLIELAGLSSQQTGSESFTSDCRWCAAFFEFALSEDFVPLFNLTRKGGALNRYPFTLVSYFLAHSVRTLQWQDRVQSVATIRKSRLKHGTPLKAGEELGFAIASWIESAKEGKRDYVALGELLSKTHMLETLELEMVALAAVARQLFRQRQSRYFLMTFGKYNQLALLASGRPQFDPLSLLRDLCESPSPISKSEAAFEPKTGMLSRGLAVTGILFKVIAVLGRHRTYQIFKGSKTEQHLSSQEVIKLIDEIVAELKILKGPILKLGQFLSFYGLEFAPEQLKKLETLQDQVTPMPKATVEEMFFEEFGKSPQEIFKSFEELPFAAGSFGQVHRAISKNGEPIAVKVQYLGAREMIQTDLKNLGLLAPLFKFVMPKLKVKPLLEELAARLHEEVDYVGEAKRCQEFAQLFADEPGLKVPQVYLELSSRRILSLEYVEGMRFSAFLAAASEEKKKWACQVLSRYIARSFTSGRVNSDPNPGNFLFLEDQICLLDFGSFKLLPKNKTKVWFDLVQAAINDDICSFRRAVDGVGFAADPSKFNYEHYFDLYRRGLMSPVFENQAHRYNQQRLNNEVKLWLGISNPDRKNTDFDADFALIFRLYFGWGMLMTAIGPALNWREIFCSFLGEFALTEENQR